MRRPFGQQSWTRRQVCVISIRRVCASTISRAAVISAPITSSSSALSSFNHFLASARATGSTAGPLTMSGIMRRVRGMRIRAIYKRRAARTGAMCLAVLLSRPHSASAIVGRSVDGAKWQSQVVMVLSRSGNQAGFCSGVVLTRRIVLTAAHCVSNASDTRVYLPGQPLIPLRRIARHPGFHADAPRTRSRSIDLALIETAEALPAEFTAPAIAGGLRYELGTKFEIAGFGVAREDDAKTSGTLRAGHVTLRAPLSSVLLWLEEPQHETGACTGDSGGPVFTEDGKLAAIVAFAEGSGSRLCVKLTQSVLIAPQRGWIEGVIAGWR